MQRCTGLPKVGIGLHTCVNDRMLSCTDGIVVRASAVMVPVQRNLSDVVQPHYAVCGTVGVFVKCRAGNSLTPQPRHKSLASFHILLGEG